MKNLSFLLINKLEGFELWRKQSSILLFWQINVENGYDINNENTSKRSSRVCKFRKRNYNECKIQTAINLEVYSLEINL